MAYRRYLVRNGKVYGPYTYENKRIGNRVISRYLGKTERMSSKIGLLLGGIIAIALLLAAASIYLQFTTTGKATLEVLGVYNKGELIDGELKFNLQAGELIPKDSIVFVSYNGHEKGFLISELVDDDIISGDFYAENTELLGSGQGYGIAGEKIIYPDVDFEALISKSGNKEKGKEDAVGAGGKEGLDGNEEEASGGVEKKEDNASEELGALPAIPIIIPNNESGAKEESGKAEPVKEGEPAEEGERNIKEAGADRESKEESKEAGKGESKGEGESQKQAGEGDNKESEKENVGDSEQAGSSSEAGAESGSVSEGGSSSSGSSSSPSESSSSGESASAPVTGAAVEEREYKISGKASKDKEFRYAIAEGENAGIVSGSVKHNGSAIGDEKVKLEVKGNEIVVSTEHFVAEKGFGEGFFGEGDGRVININLKELNLTAEEGVLKIDLIYGDIKIASVQEEIKLKGPKEKINESLINESIKLENETNLTFGNGTNMTLIINKSNLSISANIKTTRGRIKLGQPVLWKKNVSLAEPGNLSVELPAEAENISIKKIDEAEGETEANAIVKSISGNAIKADTRHEEGVLKRFWNRVFRITGRAIDTSLINAGNNTNAAGLEVVLSDNATNYLIEYYTEAPVSYEKNLSNGKEVIISGPDGLNYTDVDSFTSIDESFLATDRNEIRIYWKEAGQSMAFNAFDSDNNSIIDYIEWVTPHLSNQTFEIILITKAEHLDENRSFISDVYDYVKSRDGNWTLIPTNDYLRVKFEKNLTQGKDITIYARSASAAQVEVYEKDSETLIDTFNNILEDRKYQIIFGQWNGNQDTFDLKAKGGEVEFDYVVDPTGVTGCTELNLANTEYQQTANIIPILEASCINITADNVTFDGNGYSILNSTYKGHGVYTMRDNATIKNTNINVGYSADSPSAINLNSANDSKILNNTLGGNYGIYLFKSSRNNLTENRINTSTASAGVADPRGIYLNTKSDNNSVAWNVVLVRAGDSLSYGISLESNLSGNLITHNYINTSDTSSSIGLFSSGITLFNNAYNNNISNNIINASGVGTSATNYGIHLFMNVSNNTVIGNI